MDHEVIGKFEPDFIVYELAERFLRLPSDEGANAASLAVNKLQTSEGDALIDRRKSPENPMSRYVDSQKFDHIVETSR